MKQIKTRDLNIRDTLVGLWSVWLACGARGGAVRLRAGNVQNVTSYSYNGDPLDDKDFQVVARINACY